MGRWFLFGSALAVVSSNGFGMSLEQSQSKVVLGQPLDVSIPVSVPASEAGADLCARVSVAFGEVPVAAHLVSWSRQLDGQSPQRQKLHVRTSVAVTEPYVSLLLSVGCSGSQTRSYTFLSDIPTLPLQRTATSTEQPGRAPEVFRPSAAISASSLTSHLPSKPPEPAVAPKKRVPRLPIASTGALTPEQADSRAKRLKQADAVSAMSPVLRLDPADLMQDEAGLLPGLTMAKVLATAERESSAELESQRAQARQLWAVLSQPDSVGAALAKADALNAELAAARLSLQASERAQAAQNLTLQAVQDSRYSNPVVWSLFMALLAALGVIAFVLRKRNGGEGAAAEWWKSARLVEQPFKHLVKRRKAANLEKTAADTRISTLDVDLDTLFPQEAYKKSTSMAAPDSQSGPDSQWNSVRNAHSDFLPSVLPGTAATFMAEELFDLQQQVEFFISLGQTDQAIDVLLNHLSDGHEPSPLAYLDLLKLYHQVGQREKYESLRHEFNDQFNAAVPIFDNYSQSRRGLERYQKALTRIQNLWPSPAVLELIETSLFRQLDSQQEDMFDLEAYRELLLLYGIAREIISAPMDELPSTPDNFPLEKTQRLKTSSDANDFGATSLQPLQAREVPVQTAYADLIHQEEWSPDDHSNVDAPVLDRPIDLNSELDLDLSGDFDLVQPPDFVLSEEAELPVNVAVTDFNDAYHMLDFDVPELDDGASMAIKKSGDGI